MRNLVNNQLKTSTLTLRGLCHNLPVAMNKRHLVRASIKAFYLTGSLDETWFRASLVAQTVKNLPANAGDLGSIPELGKSPRAGNGNPLFPEEFYGQRNLVGYSLWGYKESDMAEQLTLKCTKWFI